jgi:hypothetical protein
MAQGQGTTPPTDAAPAKDYSPMLFMGFKQLRDNGTIDQESFDTLKKMVETKNDAVMKLVPLLSEKNWIEPFKRDVLVLVKGIKDEEKKSKEKDRKSRPLNLSSVSPATQVTDEEDEMNEHRRNEKNPKRSTHPPQLETGAPLLGVIPQKK